MLGLFDYTVYSFLDLSGAIAHPDLGSFVFTEGGVGQITIAMTTDKTFHEISVEGVVMIGMIPAHNGKIQIQCQQTSNIHKWLLWAYNTLILGDTDAWGKMAATLRNICDGTSHSVNGISFDKIPEKAYGTAGGMVTWTLWAADIQSISPRPTTAGSNLINKFKGLLG